MRADDPRHGTNAGYDAGCRGSCCRRAAAEYERQRRYDTILGRPPRTLDAQGTQRRIQALVAIGYTFREIAERLGVSHDRARGLATRPTQFVRRTTADDVAAVFEELCMKPAPEGWHSSYAKTTARRNGWLPPLAWLDIDDPDERPDAGKEARPGRPEVLPDVLEDFDWLVSAGESPEKAAERVGVALATIDRYRLRLAGRAS